MTGRPGPSAAHRRSLRARAASGRPGARRMPLMAPMLAGMGVLHFATPTHFDRLIPPELPGSARAWTYGSGVAELSVAGLLAVPRTRRMGAWAAIALFVGVFPGNVQMARDSLRKPVWPNRVVAFGRLPLQWPMISAAWRIRRAEAARS